MEKQNDWLEMNIRVIDGIRRQLIDYHMKGSYGGEIELLQIERLLRGGADQISQLQKEISTLTKRNEELEERLKQSNTPTETPDIAPPVSSRQTRQARREARKPKVEVADA